MNEGTGLKITWTQFGLGVGPVVPFPATEAERTKTAEEAGKAALLLSKLSPAQKGLFKHLAEASPNGYFVPTVSWIETVLKATKTVREEDMPVLRGLDWTPSSVTLDELRSNVLAAVKNAGNK